jgi:hypothetical protein
MEHRWSEIDRGTPNCYGKNLSSVTLPTTNPTWTEPGSNPGIIDVNNKMEAITFAGYFVGH